MYRIQELFKQVLVLHNLNNQLSYVKIKPIFENFRTWVLSLTCQWHKTVPYMMDVSKIKNKTIWNIQLSSYVSIWYWKIFPHTCTVRLVWKPLCEKHIMCLCEKSLYTIWVKHLDLSLPTTIFEHRCTNKHKAGLDLIPAEHSPWLAVAWPLWASPENLSLAGCCCCYQRQTSGSAQTLACSLL